MTSLSTAGSVCFTEASDTTGYTSDSRRDADHRVKGTLSAGRCEDEGGGLGGQEDDMAKFLLGPGWYDHRVPPSERLKLLYRLLEEHYDLTGGDYYGQRTFRVHRTKKAAQLEEYPVTCIRYLVSIGVNPNFLRSSNEVSPDPMRDLIEEAFYSPFSPSLIFNRRAGPISTWEIDWSRPLPRVTRTYWEMMQRTRPRPTHEFTRAKPAAGDRLVDPQPCCRSRDLPQYYHVENARSTSRFRTVLLKARGLFKSH